MTTLAVWAVEWQLALRHRRPFVLRTLLPLALVIPIASSGLAPRQTAGAYVLIFVGLGILGSALTLAKEAERGMSARVVRGGVTPASYVLQRAAAGAALEVVRFLPALVVAAVGAAASLAGVGLALGALVVTAWICTLVGTAVACLSRSLGEAGVLTVVITVLLAHASGVFRAPSPGSAGAYLELAAPFTALHGAALGMASGASPGGVVALAAWAVILPVGMVVLASRMCGSMGRRADSVFEGV